MRNGISGFRIAALAVSALFVAPALVACAENGAAQGTKAGTEQASVAVTIATADGKKHDFKVEQARTRQEQDQGLMFRTDIPDNGGMLFFPYPAEGGGPREASFWMRNTPSPLDILFIRQDGSIATIAENTVPFSETPIRSGEPVAAVLELRGGRAAELGIAPGDTVRWTGAKE
jgi:uncharacterized membrane protein (UPF0127 family)